MEDAIRNFVPQFARISALTISLATGSSGCISHSDAPFRGTIPARPSHAMTGSQFMNMTKSYSPEERERAILNELRRGNVPSFLRQLQPVRVSGVVPGGQTVTGTFWAMPDYLAIGSDQDFVRIPTNPMTAQAIADLYGFVLPTSKMVDTIYQQAEVRLMPSPMAPTSRMVSNDYYVAHNQTIERQLQGRQRGSLVAGHKKDVVVSSRLISQPRRVAIYGWHRTNGSAIQPLSLVHGNTYADYSHGIRLVSSVMKIEGKDRLVTDVLKDWRLASLLSSEGVLSRPRIPMYEPQARDPISFGDIFGSLQRLFISHAI